MTCSENNADQSRGLEIAAPNPAALTAFKSNIAENLFTQVAAFSAMVTDLDCRIVWVNPAFERLSGWTLAEIHGRRPQDFLHGPLTDPETIRRILDSTSEQRSLQAEIVNYRKDGSPYWASIDAHPLTGSDGEIVGYFSLQTDITSRHNAELQIAREHRLIKALSKARSRFIASDSVSAVFELLLEQLQSVTESPYGFIGEVCRDDAQEPWMRIHAITDISWDAASRKLYSTVSDGGMDFRFLDNMIGLTLRTERPVISNEMFRHPHLLRLPAGHPELTSFAGLPIHYGGRFLAVAGIANRPGGYDQTLIDFISPLLETIGELIDARNRDLQRRRVEESLKQTEAWLEETGHVAGVGGWQVSLEHGEIRWTSQTRRIHGVSADYKPQLEDALLFYDEPGRELIRQAVANGLQHGQAWDLELPFTSADGRKLWVRAKGQAAFEGNKVVRLFGTFQDITERIHAEQRISTQFRILQLIAGRSPLRVTLHRICQSIQSQIPSVITEFQLIDERRQIPCVRVGLESFETGSDSEASVPDSWVDIEELSGGFRGRLCLRGLDLHNADSRQKQVISESVALAAIAMNRAIEDEQLQKSEARLKAALRRAHLGYWELDISSGLLDWSDDIYEILGRDRSYHPTLSSFFAEIVHPDDVAALQAVQQRAMEQPGVVHNMDTRCLRLDGSLCWAAIEGTCEVDLLGNPVRIRGTIQDITDRKRDADERTALHAQLLRAQKMESIGRLAGGVAHDFNNMLAVILGHAEMALFDSAMPEKARDSFLAIQQAGQRSADLTRQLLTFARRQTATPQVILLNQSINQMLLMLKRLIGENIDLVWNPGADLWPLLIDPIQIDQILTNLLVNARDAIHGTGRITISTSNEWTMESPLHPEPRPFVVLSIADTGVGIPQDAMPHIFEPFFTTKEPGKGTGLGLATVFGIVEQNRGFIQVNSQAGTGTSFQIYLPRMAESPVPRPKLLPIAGSSGAGGCVLLVEDETELLRIGRMSLQQLGYSVFTASLPSEAIRIFTAHSSAIRVVVTDVIMPEMSGWELADHLKRIRPDLSCVFMSGYANTPSEDIVPAESEIIYLSKPFEINQLAAAIRRAFCQTRAANTDPQPGQLR